MLNQPSSNQSVPVFITKILMTKRNTIIQIIGFIALKAKLSCNFDKNKATRINNDNNT